MAEKTQAKMGRPLKHSGDRKRHVQSVRVRDSIKDKLSQSAERMQRSISEEMEARLELSFEMEREFGDGEALTHLVRLISQSIHMVADRLGESSDAYELARDKPMVRNAMQAAVMDLAERHLAPRYDQELELVAAGVSSANGRQIAQLVDIKSAVEIRLAGADTRKQLISALKGIHERNAYIAELEARLSELTGEKGAANE